MRRVPRGWGRSQRPCTRYRRSLSLVPVDRTGYLRQKAVRKRASGLPYSFSMVSPPCSFSFLRRFRHATSLKIHADALAALERDLFAPYGRGKIASGPEIACDQVQAQMAGIGLMIEADLAFVLGNPHARQQRREELARRPGCRGVAWSSSSYSSPSTSRPVAGLRTPGPRSGSPPADRRSHRISERMRRSAAVRRVRAQIRWTGLEMSSAVVRWFRYLHHPAPAHAISAWSGPSRGNRGRSRPHP